MFFQPFDQRDRESLELACGPVMMDAVRDPDIIEILLNPDGKVWTERYGEDQKETGFIDIPQAKIILSLVATSLGITVSHLSPIVEGEFPLDGSRFEGVFAPIVGPGSSFALRKKASKVITLAEYLQSGTITDHVLEIIETAVRQLKNIVVVGGTSSGKTTFVNGIIDAIARLTPAHRLAILEDTAELQSNSENVVFLRTSSIPGAEITMRHLARVCMRYAPKRILIGEVRDGAALELLKLWNTGHPGGVGTFHADSADEALERLEELVEEAGLGPKQRLIGRAVDLVVYMEKTSDNRRVVSSIKAVNGFNPRTQTYITETLYDSNPFKNAVHRSADFRRSRIHPHARRSPRLGRHYRVLQSA